MFWFLGKLVRIPFPLAKISKHCAWTRPLPLAELSCMLIQSSLDKHVQVEKVYACSVHQRDAELQYAPL